MVFGLFGSPNHKKEGEVSSNANNAVGPSASSKSSADQPGFASIRGCTAIVTGSSGLCGARLVEMLIERGAKTVVAFDLAPPNTILAHRFAEAQAKTGGKGKIIVCSGREEGDITSDAAVTAAFTKAAKAAAGGDDNAKIDCVYHLAALVGPFFDRDKYLGVNYHGTLRIIHMCKIHNVPKLVYSSSPSTRFTGADVEGLTEDELPMPNKWLAMYAEGKAKGEMAVTALAKDEPDETGYVLKAVSVAPHQIYGPHDNLFLPNLLETAGNGRLRIFGEGRSLISVCYVDNYCHGLMCGADALDTNPEAVRGKFYIITDREEPVLFWKFINRPIVEFGFVDLETKFHLPVWLLYAVAYVANVLGVLMNKKFKLNPFNVRMLTMHRYFSIQNAKRDLKYAPVLEHDEAWTYTLAWFKEHWLPKYLQNTGKQVASPSVEKKIAATKKTE